MFFYVTASVHVKLHDIAHTIEMFLAGTMEKSINFSRPADSSLSLDNHCTLPPRFLLHKLVPVKRKMPRSSVAGL